MNLNFKFKIKADIINSIILKIIIIKMSNFNTDPETTNNYDSINLRDNETQPKIIAEESVIKVEEPGKGIKEKTMEKISDFKNYIKNAISGETFKEENQNSIQPDCRQKTMSYLQEKIEVERNYKLFFVLLSLGGLLACLSLFFLPLIIVAPRKFVSFFSLGSLLILISFLFIYGTKSYFEKLFSKERYIFTIMFFASIFLGIFCAIINSYFFLSLLCAGIQVFTLVIFTLSFIPGGQSGISAIFSSFSTFLPSFLRSN